MKYNHKHLNFISKLGVLLLILSSCNKTAKHDPIQEDNSKNTNIVTQFVFSTDSLKRYQFPTHINDLIIDRAKSSFSEVFMVVLYPGQAPPFHKHDDTEQIFYVIEGTGVLTISDEKKTIIVKPGNVVRIPISTYHSIKADNEKVLKYLCVDCFGEKPKIEVTWDDHVKTLCKNNGWDYNKVISSQK